MSEPATKFPNGLSVDASGAPAVDPTANVIALIEAANKRQDDLRELYDRLCKAEIRRIDDIAFLRAEHAKDLARLESDRLNAIRQVDVLAVNTAAERAAQAISAVAVTTASNAENLRNALNTTATTIANQTSATFTAITERLAALEKSSYEGKGKQSFSDPVMAELVAEMKTLRESRAQGSGKSEGISASWGVLLGVFGLIGAVIGIMGWIAK